MACGEEGDGIHREGEMKLFISLFLLLIVIGIAQIVQRLDVIIEQLIRK